MIRYSKEQILNSVNIARIADKFSVGLEQVNTGNFTHRCKCPSAEHKGGSERTGSLYIDEVNNNFYCFGCGASNNVIDFYMLCAEKDFSESILDLSGYVDADKVKNIKVIKKVNNFQYLIMISNEFRNLQKFHSEDMEWIEKFIKHTDQRLCSIDRHDVGMAKKILNKIKLIISRRYQNK